MIKVVDLPLEMMWKNSPVVSRNFRDTTYFAMMDSGTMIPMYFGNRNLLEKVLDGKVLDEKVSLRAANGKVTEYDVVACSLIIDKLTFPNLKFAWLPKSEFQFQFLLSYTMFRGCRTVLDDAADRLEVYAPQTPDMYVRRPYIVKGDGVIFSLFTG